MAWPVLLAAIVTSYNTTIGDVVSARPSDGQLVKGFGPDLTLWAPTQTASGITTTIEARWAPSICALAPGLFAFAAVHRGPCHGGYCVFTRVGEYASGAWTFGPAAEIPAITTWPNPANEQDSAVALECFSGGRYLVAVAHCPTVADPTDAYYGFTAVGTATAAQPGRTGTLAGSVLPAQHGDIATSSTGAATVLICIRAATAWSRLRYTGHIACWVVTQDLAAETTTGQTATPVELKKTATTWALGAFAVQWLGGAQFALAYTANTGDVHLALGRCGPAPANEIAWDSDTAVVLTGAKGTRGLSLARLPSGADPRLFLAHYSPAAGALVAQVYTINATSGEIATPAGSPLPVPDEVLPQIASASPQASCRVTSQVIDGNILVLYCDQQHGAARLVRLDNATALAPAAAINAMSGAGVAHLVQAWDGATHAFVAIDQATQRLTVRTAGAPDSATGELPFDDDTSPRPLGIAQEAKAAGEVCEVAIAGVAETGVGWAPGSAAYLNGDGTLSPDPNPARQPGVQARRAQAVGATQVLLT